MYKIGIIFSLKVLEKLPVKLSGPVFSFWEDFKLDCSVLSGYSSAQLLICS